MTTPSSNTAKDHPVLVRIQSAEHPAQELILGRSTRSDSDSSKNTQSSRKPLKYQTFHARNFSLARPFMGGIHAVELQAGEISQERLQKLFKDCPAASSITIKGRPNVQVLTTFLSNLGSHQVKELTCELDEGDEIDTTLGPALRNLQVAELHPDFKLESKRERSASAGAPPVGSGNESLGLLAPSASTSVRLFEPRHELRGELKILPDKVCVILRQQLLVTSQDRSEEKKIIQQELLQFRAQVAQMLRQDTQPAQFVHADGRVDTRTIAQRISDFETHCPTMVHLWKTKQIGWKEYVAKIKISDDSEMVCSDLLQIPRKHAVAMVAEIADILALRVGIPHCTFQDVGTNGVKSDIDYSAVCKSHKFWTNAIQGQKMAYANILWWSLFDGPVAFHADCNYYGPHIGKYYTDEMQNPVAKEIFAYASLMGSLVQLHAHTQHAKGGKEKAKGYIDILKQNLQVHSKSTFPGDKNRCMATLKAIDACLEDVQELEECVEKMRQVSPTDNQLEDIVSDFLLTSFSQLLADIAKKIDTESKKDHKEILIAQYYYYTVLRERFLSDGFCTKGAFDVTCNNLGSQAYLVFQSKLEASQVDPGQEFSQQVFRRSSPQDHLDCMTENSAFAAGKDTYLGFAKSIVRAAHSARTLMQSMLQQSKDALESAQDKLKNETAAPERNALAQHILDLEKRVKQLQQQVSDGNSYLRSMELLLALKKQEFDKLSFTDLFWKKFDDLEYERYTETKKQLLALEPAFYTKQRTLEECIEYFAHETQKHFKLNDAGKKRYFHSKALLSHPNSKLQELIRYYETFNPDAEKRTKASSKVEGIAPSATRMKQHGRRKLWPRLLEQFDYAFQTKRKDNIQALKELAECIYEESTKGEKNFKPVHEHRLGRDDLFKVLSEIYCGNISKIEKVKIDELLQLAECVEKTGRIYSDSGTIQLVLQKLAEKEITKLKQFFLKDKKPEDISEAELLSKLKDHFLTEHAAIAALVFATGFAPTPQKPEELPSYASTLCNPDLVKQYFSKERDFSKAFESSTEIDMYGYDVKSRDHAKDDLKLELPTASQSAALSLSTESYSDRGHLQIVLPGESDLLSDMSFPSSPLPSPQASPHSSPVLSSRTLSIGRPRSFTDENTKATSASAQPSASKYLSVGDFTAGSTLLPPPRLDRRRSADPASKSFFDKAKERVQATRTLQTSLQRPKSIPTKPPQES